MMWCQTHNNRKKYQKLTIVVDRNILEKKIKSLELYNICTIIIKKSKRQHKYPVACVWLWVDSEVGKLKTDTWESLELNFHMPKGFSRHWPQFWFVVKKKYIFIYPCRLQATFWKGSSFQFFLFLICLDECCRTVWKYRMTCA